MTRYKLKKESTYGLPNEKIFFDGEEMDFLLKIAEAENLPLELTINRCVRFAMQTMKPLIKYEKEEVDTKIPEIENQEGVKNE